MRQSVPLLGELHESCDGEDLQQSIDVGSAGDVLLGCSGLDANPSSLFRAWQQFNVHVGVTCVKERGHSAQNLVVLRHERSRCHSF